MFFCALHGCNILKSKLTLVRDHLSVRQYQNKEFIFSYNYLCKILACVESRAYLIRLVGSMFFGNNLTLWRVLYKILPQIFVIRLLFKFLNWLLQAGKKFKEKRRQLQSIILWIQFSLWQTLISIHWYYQCQWPLISCWICLDDNVHPRWSQIFLFLLFLINSKVTN